MSVSREIAKVDKLLGAFSPERSNIIPMLQAVQGKLGYLPKAAIERISAFTRVPEAEIYGVASFYTQFRFTPVGKHKFTVCRGTACHVLGSKRLVDELQDAMGIEPGGTTEDMMFSLETVACFGSCALAPLVVVDGKVYGRMTPQRTRELVDNLRSGKEEKTTKEKAKKAEPKKKSEAKKKASAKKAAGKKSAAKTKRASSGSKTKTSSGAKKSKSGSRRTR